MKALIVDAGATKTDFTLLAERKIVFRHSSAGINPNYSSESEIMRVFAEIVQRCPKEFPVENVFFYGAGCALQRNASWMEGLIANFFPCAEIKVYSDLVAVCHALSMRQTSVVSILGTGSASCLFDGKEIVSRAPSLGYMLGDEGSGTNLGKRLLATYLRGQLPAEMALELEKTYNLNFEKVIYRIYKEPEPNLLMSQLSIFIQKHIDSPLMQKLTLEAFCAFFATQKGHYPESSTLKWHLSGSVAYYYRDIINQAAKIEHCPLGMIVATPMEKLIDYYKKLS